MRAMPLPFPLIFLGLFIGLAVVRACHRPQKPVERAAAPPLPDRLRSTLSALLSGVVIVFGFHHVFGLFPWFAAFAVTLPNWLRWSGVAGAVGSLLMLHQVHRDLGESFSVRLQVHQDLALVTNGWYARIRHPMYSALCGFFLCASVVAANVLVAGPALGIAAILVVRTGPEERMMAAHFGAVYDEYCGRTGRLWPRFRGVTPQTRRR
jgi:protein-S-isoprenylcysteine O-methyltransferase Ste14